MEEITEFCKLMRKIRFDSNESLRAMAKRLNISAAFLSSLELGKKQIPADYQNKIAVEYQLDEQDCKALEEAIYKTNNRVTIGLKDLNSDKKDLTLMFARHINTMDDELIKELREKIAVYENKN